MQRVHGCQLQYLEYEVDDAGNLLHNYRMDPGETVNVIMKIKNKGDDVAPEIRGILSSNDQYITILDSIGTFGTLLPDSSGRNISDYFRVKVSENCPEQYEAEYTIRLMTQNGLYPYSTTSSFIIPVAEPTQSDPTGPDEYGYYAYSEDDTLWTQAPEYDWVDITSVGTTVYRPGISSDFSTNVNLPFTFKYYGMNRDTVQISSNGWIALSNGTLNNHNNETLPNQDEIRNMIAVFWDNLFYAGAGEVGKIYYYYDEANHRFIVSWENVGHSEDVTDKETFQVILLDPQYYPTATGDGEIIMQYKVVEEPGSCTVGIENYGEDIGINYLYDDYYDVTASIIHSNFAIKFTTDSAVVVSVRGGEIPENLIPDKYTLEQNYPNPFNPETHIRYSIPEAGFISLKIYRIDGQLVKVLSDDFQPAGVYEKIWDGTNDRGMKVSSGVYFYRLSTDRYSQVRKMLFIK